MSLYLFYYSLVPEPIVSTYETISVFPSSTESFASDAELLNSECYDETKYGKFISFYNTISIFLIF